MNKNRKIITISAVLLLSLLVSCEKDKAPVSESPQVQVVSETQGEVVVPETTTVEETTTIGSGQLQTVEAATSGTVRFVQTGDISTIQLQDFKTSSAPDLGIYISKKSSISSSTDISSAIKITELKSFSGDQTYTLPADIDLSQYNSIAIHCTQYNKLFGAASMTQIK